MKKEDKEKENKKYKDKNKIHWQWQPSGKANHTSEATHFLKCHSFAYPP